MKKKYTIKFTLTLLLGALFLMPTQAQFKLVKVDPEADTVTIKNFGNSTENVGNHRLCSLITYRTLSSQTTVIEGSLNLAPGAEVTVSIAGNWIQDSADLGLYLPSGSFGLPENMIDFLQWGSAGNGRESVAVSKGIWGAGTFINATAPYEFTGGANDFGVNFWQTALNNKKFFLKSYNIIPNPAKTYFNLELPNHITKAYLQVYDVLGKEILNKPIVSKNTIDISSWTNGIYLVKVTNNKNTHTKRFIKQ